MPGFQLNSVHLYLGYTALIAGAIGGLGLMSKQATPNVSVEVEPIPTPSSKTSASPQAERKEASSKPRSEEHTSELQSRQYLVCRLLLEKTHKNTRPHLSPRPLLRTTPRKHLSAPDRHRRFFFPHVLLPPLARNPSFLARAQAVRPARHQ